jgi:secreted Zn-dependent insulinase-like peptidase
MFSTGDLTTLDKPGVHDALTSFHDAYYTAPRMRLAVLGKNSLQDLRRFANTCVQCVYVKQVRSFFKHTRSQPLITALRAAV